MKFDNHIHSHFSPCCLMKPHQIIHAAKASGLDSIVISDHNTCLGAIEALEIGGSETTLVIEIGIEVMTQYGEFGINFLTLEEAHIIERSIGRKAVTPFQRIMGLVDELKKNTESRLLVDLHHPFSCSFFDRRKSLDTRAIIKDGILASQAEIMNFFDYIELNGSNMSVTDSKLALILARHYGKPFVCSSDAHFQCQIGKYYSEGFGATVIDSIKNNKIKIPHIKTISYFQNRFLRMGSKLVRILRQRISDRWV